MKKAIITAVVLTNLAVGIYITAISWGHDYVIIGYNTFDLLDGMRTNGYPGFTAIVAGFTIVTGNIDIALKATPVLFVMAYLTGVYALCKELGLNRTIRGVAVILASIPVFPPYMPHIGTAYVAMLAPWCMWGVLYAIRTKRTAAVIGMVAGFAVMPLMHLQLVQAMAIFLIIVMVFKRKEVDGLKVAGVGLATLMVCGGAWAWYVGWLALPVNYVVSNIDGLSTGIFRHGGDFQTTVSITLNSPGVMALVALGWLAIMRTFWGYENKARRLELRAISAAVIAFVALYMTFVFSTYDGCQWVGGRMLIFVYPFAIVANADLLAKLFRRPREVRVIETVKGVV